MADTVIFLTTTGLGTWTVPADWNNWNNTIECIGAGAAGGCICAAGANAVGGGGGAYSKKVNVTLTANSSIAVQVGGGGAANVVTGSGWLPTNAYTAIVAYGGPTRFGDSLSTNTACAYAGASSDANNYLIIARGGTAIPVGTTVTKIGYAASSAGNVTLKIIARTSAGNYIVLYSQVYAHGGTGWEDCTLSTPFTVPSTGPSAYLASWGAAGVNVGFSGVSAVRSNKQGTDPTAGTTLSSVAEDTGTSVGIRWVGYAMADATIAAAGGEPGSITTGTGISGGTGGAAAAGIGTTKQSGGRGGNYAQGSGGTAATGGGGAGGSHGDGNAGGDLTGNAGIQASAGGQGDSTSGGTGGNGSTSGDASSGSTSTEYTSNPGGATGGPGGGGGGVAKATNQTAGSGANYGAGGGGAASTATSTAETSGAGGQGIIIITYKPLVGPMQDHYRFRTDTDAVDATPTWGANEDTGGFYPATDSTPFRLRFKIEKVVD